MTGDEGVSAKFERYLRSLGEDLAVVAAEPLVGGRSARIIRLRLRDGAGTESDVVLSEQNDSGPLSGVGSVGARFDVLGALEGTNVMAPRALWMSEDPEPIGSRFLVTELMPGVAVDPWRTQGREMLRELRQSTRFRDEIVGALASIHAVSGDELPASARRDHSVSTGRRELERWGGVIGRSDSFRNDPVLTYAMEWLARNEPPQEEWTLWHGDFRVGNLLLEEGRVTAVLDWEFASEGDPIYDVVLLSSPPLLVDGYSDGIWQAEDLLERYERATGRTISPHQRRFYTVLSTLKICCVWVNGSIPFDQRQDDLAALRSGFSVIQLLGLLAATLQLPAPPAPSAGAESSYGRALGLLRLAMRDEVLPNVESKQAREVATVVSGVLRSMARAADGEAATTWALDVEGFLEDLGGASAGFEDDDRNSIEVRFAEAIKFAFQAEGSVGEGLEKRMRELVGHSLGRLSQIWP